MEKPPLERVIEKLEKLDLREWDLESDNILRHGSILSAKTGGLRFYLTKGGFKGDLLEGDGVYYELIIRKIDKNAGYIKYYYNKNDKASRAKLERLYTKVLSALQESHDAEILERLNEFLSE